MAAAVMDQSKEIFDEHFKHDLLSLVGDRTSNVRLVLARVLGTHFRQVGSSTFDPLVNHAIRLLKADRNHDTSALVIDLQLL